MIRTKITDPQAHTAYCSMTCWELRRGQGCCLRDRSIACVGQVEQDRVRAITFMAFEHRWLSVTMWDRDRVSIRFCGTPEKSLKWGTVPNLVTMTTYQAVPQMGASGHPMLLWSVSTQLAPPWPVFLCLSISLSYTHTHTHTHTQLVWGTVQADAYMLLSAPFPIPTSQQHTGCWAVSG